MHSAEAIIAIHGDRLNRLALTFDSEQGPFLQLHVDIDKIFDAHELVEAQVALDDLALIELRDACRVNPLSNDAKRA